MDIRKKVGSVIFILLWGHLLSGCKSTASLAYQIDHASERSKYVRETYVSEDEMRQLESYSANLEGKLPQISFNDANLTYGFGQATDVVTGLAVAGSAAGMLSTMSDLSMGALAFSSLFDSSHIEKRKIYHPDLFVVRERSDKNDNIKRKSFLVKGFVKDVKDTYSEINDALERHASKNGWKKKREWKSLQVGMSDAYSNTGVCKDDNLLVFFSHYYRKAGYERGHSVSNGVLDGGKIGKPGKEFNVLSIGWSPFCVYPDVTPGKDKVKGESVSSEIKIVLALKMSEELGSRSSFYFYLPPSKNKGGLPIPAVAHDGEIYWMASLK